MKTFSLMILSFLLSACSPIINGAHVERAIKNCENHGGIASLYTPTFFAIFDFENVFTAECVDGTKPRLTKLDGTKPRLTKLEGVK